MNYDLVGVGEALGMKIPRLYPCAVDCPLCSAVLKLELRGADYAVCSNCWFIGDMLTLYSTKLNKPIDEALKQLEAQKLLTAGPWVAKYLLELELDLKFRKLLRSRKEAVDAQMYASAQGVLVGLGMDYNHAHLAKLSPYALPMFANDIEDLGVVISKDHKETMRWWGKYGALALPVWSGVAVCGVWIITKQGYRYLAFRTTDGVVGGITTGSTYFVLDTPINALKYHLWSYVAGGSAVVFPTGATKLPPGKALYWTPEGRTAWYVKALKHLDASVVPHWCYGAGEYPAHGLPRAFLGQALQQAIQPHAALAQHLLQTPEAAVGLDINVDDRSLVLSYGTVTQQQQLQQLLAGGTTKITWNDVEIIENAEGWYANGKLISKAVIHLTEIRPMGTKGEAQLTGTISYNKTTWQFKELLSKIGRNQGEWLRQQVLLKAGSLMSVDPAWKTLLLELAQHFHEPHKIVADQLAGWSEGTLRLNHFMVDLRGVFPSENALIGPTMRVPTTLAVHEMEAFKSDGFCQLYLAILGNLVRGRFGAPLNGILLTDEPSVVRRYSNLFGLPVLEDLATDLINSCPLPQPAVYSDLRKLFAAPGHIITSVDVRSSKLAMMQQGWIQIRAGDIPDFSALRHVVLALPMVLRNPPDVGSPLFYRQLTNLLPSSRAMQLAATDLDLHCQLQDSNKAARILRLMFYGIETGVITPDYGDSAIGISSSQLLELLEGPVPMPGIAEISRTLQDAKYITSPLRGQLAISRSCWDLHASLYGLPPGCAPVGA